MINVEHLTKYYGDFMAIQDISFEIDAGHVYGFLGPNGAGKSTTMNIIAGCLSATDGKVMIGGHNIFDEPEACKKLIGYLPEQPPLYLNETPLEYLEFVGGAKGLKGSELQQQIPASIQQAGIEEVQNRLISSLSKGFRQRVGIAQALLGNPEVIILDEPTVGLDPRQIIEIRDLIRELGKTHTVIFSSHILSEVQTICEKVLIISKGNLIAFDTPDNLEKMMKQSAGINMKVLAGMEKTRETLRSLESITDFSCTNSEDGITSVHIGSGSDTQDLRVRLFFAFADKKLPILEMTSVKANLEEVFIELTEKESAAEEVPPALSSDDEPEESDQNNESEDTNL